MLQSRPIWSLLPLIIVLIFLLAACRRGDKEVPFAQGDQARIACSKSCAAHGQCGTLPDSRRVVLANQSGPTVSLHDRLYADGAAVTIMEKSERQLIAARDGEPLTGQATPFPHTFYLVRNEGEGKDGWVSEWCLARP